MTTPSELLDRTLDRAGEVVRATEELAAAVEARGYSSRDQDWARFLVERAREIRGRINERLASRDVRRLRLTLGKLVDVYVRGVEDHPFTGGNCQPQEDELGKASDELARSMFALYERPQADGDRRPIDVALEARAGPSQRQR